MLKKLFVVCAAALLLAGCFVPQNNLVGKWKLENPESISFSELTLEFTKDKVIATGKVENTQTGSFVAFTLNAGYKIYEQKNDVYTIKLIDTKIDVTSSADFPAEAKAQFETALKDAFKKQEVDYSQYSVSEGGKKLTETNPNGTPGATYTKM